MDADQPSPNHVVLHDDRFGTVIRPRAASLLALADQLAAPAMEDADPRRALLTRPFLSTVLSQASQIEELLDAYGAAHNARWCDVRSVMAALKLFSRVHYVLLHLELAIPGYRLAPVAGDFVADTRQATAAIGALLRAACLRLRTEALDRNLPSAAAPTYPEALPPGRLLRDRQVRQVDSAPETVTRLASAFLHQVGEAAFLSEYATADRDPPEAPKPTCPEEPELRDVEERFHNLQALYDTHLSNTDIEDSDPTLRSLRGHASVIFHLLEIATDLAHFHERHMSHCRQGQPPPPHHALPSLGCDDLPRLLRRYPLRYAALYLQSGRTLAQRLLHRYGQPGTLQVAVPRYRGFHVRPSTLLARIVHHYGSDVSLTLDGDTYDASSTLDLFRANERINAHKRRWLAEEISRVCQALPNDPERDPATTARRVLLRLAEQSKIILYEQPLASLHPRPPTTSQDIGPITEEITRLQSLGKIDIETDLNAEFRGDQRVLEDIRRLAEHGYGEDAYGNNVALPKELSYLRRGG